MNIKNLLQNYVYNFIFQIEDVQMRTLQSQQTVPVGSVDIKDETGITKVSMWIDLSSSDRLEIDNYISVTRKDTSTLVHLQI